MSYKTTKTQQPLSFRERARKQLHRALLVIGIASMVWYLLWRIFFTLPFGYDALSFGCGIMMLCGEISAFFESMENYQNLSKVDPPEKPNFEDIPIELLPDVDVLIATHNEPVDLLRKTVNGCLNMYYPDPSKVHVYLCDDGDRAAVAEMAKETGVGYFGLSGNKLAKAGNLNNAIFKTTSPLLATFDADMIPMHSFLTSMVPYFFMPLMKKDADGKHWSLLPEQERDPNWKIGFIQAPQSFYNEDLFQYNLYQEDAVPNEQDYFFREINVGRNRANAPIYAGSNTVITREALASVGGIVTGTITEDFATGLLIQEQGFSCYAVPEIVANGLAPNTVIDLIKQRERWGRGCIQTIKTQKFLVPHKLSLRTKISYWNCFMYWWTFFRRFLYIFSPIIFVLFNLRVMVCDLRGLLVFWLPCFVLFSNSPLFDRSRIRTKRISNVIDTILFPYMIIPIFLETIGVSQRKFNVTKKDGVVSSNSDIRLSIPYFILLAMSILALLLCVVNSIRYQTFGFVIVGYWLLVNVYYLIMAIFFMLGRLNQRKNMRYQVALPVRMQTPLGPIYGRTIDISENGISWRMDKPYYLPSEGYFRFTAYNERYQADMLGLLRFAQQDEDGHWRYGVECIPADETQELQYLQLIYDREHTLPQYVDRQQFSLLQDISDNILRRQEIYAFQKQRILRVPLDVEAYEASSNQAYFIYDFNYQYASLDIQKNMPAQLTLQAALTPGGQRYPLVLEAVSSRSSHGKQHKLYRVKNSQELASQLPFVRDLNSRSQTAQKERKAQGAFSSLLADDSSHWSDISFC